MGSGAAHCEVGAGNEFIPGLAVRRKDDDGRGIFFVVATAVPLETLAELCGSDMPDPTSPSAARHDSACAARFRALLDAHLDRLLRSARRRTGSEADAEDLVQECCLRAWNGFASLREEAAGYVWLLSILDGAIADHYRKLQRRQHLLPVVDLDEAVLLSLASEEPGPCERVIAAAESRALHAALQGLPEVFAQPLMLYDFEGLRYREIAELLRLPIGTVMSRLARARRMLAALLLSTATERSPAVAQTQNPRAMP